jgi:hypothetical protein
VFLSLNRITPAPNVQRCYTPRKRAQAGLSGAVEAGNSRIPGFDNLLSFGSCGTCHDGLLGMAS